MSTPELLSTGSAVNSLSSTPSLEQMANPPRSVPSDLPSLLVNGRDKDGETSSLRSVAASTKSAFSRLASPRIGQDGSSSPKSATGSLAASGAAANKKVKQRKQVADKWWRVSDEKVREAKTSEVLGMQREVYLLFYELDREGL